MSLNTITIMGRMVKDPERRYTQSQKAVTSFTLAVERDYAAAGEKREVDFIDCVTWNATADFVVKYFRKGDMAVVRGRLQSRDWTDKDGNKRRAWEVIADCVYFGESKPKEKTDTQQTVGRFTEIPDDGPDPELPF